MLLFLSISFTPTTLVMAKILSYIGAALSMHVLCISALIILSTKRWLWRVVHVKYPHILSAGMEGEIVLDIANPLQTLLSIVDAEIVGDLGFETKLRKVEQVSTSVTRIFLTFIARVGMHIGTTLKLVLLDKLRCVRIYVSIQLYPITIRVVPSISSEIKLRSAPSIRLLGLVSSRRRGSGSTVFEIREYVPGDDYRSIEWKATARTGKLMVREYELETLRGMVLALALHDAFFIGKPSAFELLTPIIIRLALSLLSTGTWIRIAIVTERGVTISDKITRYRLNDLARCFSSTEWPTTVSTYSSSNRVIKHVVTTLVEESCREPCTAMVFLDPLEDVDIVILKDIAKTLVRKRHVFRALLVSPRVIRFAAGALHIAELYALSREVSRLASASRALPHISIPLLGATLTEITTKILQVVDSTAYRY